MRPTEYGFLACREMRQLLGVYVVGAIDPAERALVEEHLATCRACRDELASLAGLPAMLSRVPAADVEQISSAPAGLPEMAEPSPELLSSLLRKVAVKRRRRVWRGVVAAAAAAAIAAGSASAAIELSRPAATAQTEVASAASHDTGVSAVVDYSSTPWGGTAMRVQVSGVPAGTRCQFWVVGKGGRAYAGAWTVESYRSEQPWYTVGSQEPPNSVQSFQLTSGGKVLLTIPA